MTENVCFVDTECLGLDADVHPVWEVGLITPDGEEYCWQLQVTGRDLALAHPKALEIGRFDERYDHGSAHHPADFAPEFKALTEGLHLCGAVISFDEERLRRLLWKHGFAPGWHYHIIDSETLVVGWLAAGHDPIGGPVGSDKCQPPWDSNELSLAVGVDPEDFDRHTALGDARWARALWLAVMGDKE